MKSSAKLADVAKAAGVSAGTASNVFNRPEIVSAEVRERVEAAARRLGYNGPDPRGRMLRAGKVNAIGVVGPTAYCFEDPFTRLVMAGIAEECDARGAGMALVSSKESPATTWGIPTALVDGFIVHCQQVDESLLALARERRLPFVALDLDAGPGTSSVLIEDRRGAFLAAQHLLELGHRKIAVVCLKSGKSGKASAEGPVTSEQVLSASFQFIRDRAMGYDEALAAHGLRLSGLPIAETKGSRRSAAQVVGDLLAAHPETTAVLAMADAIALGALDAARARGLRVPEDLSVVGFDDVPEAAESDPPLTTVNQQAMEKGRVAARLVFEPDPPRTEVLPVTLVVRRSTGKPRGA
jgi:DNA-binding LacI/PurR family transcriptional regulator